MSSSTLTKVVEADDETLRTEIERLEVELRDFNRSVNVRLAEDEHGQLEANAAAWGEMLRKLLRRHGTPGGPQHPNFQEAAALLALLDNVKTMHALIDELTPEVFSDMKRAEVEERRAHFEKETVLRRLSLERREQQARLDAEQAALEAIDKELGA